MLRASGAQKPVLAATVSAGDWRIVTAVPQGAASAGVWAGTGAAASVVYTAPCDATRRAPTVMQVTAKAIIPKDRSLPRTVRMEVVPLTPNSSSHKSAPSIHGATQAHGRVTEY